MPTRATFSEFEDEGEGADVIVCVCREEALIYPAYVRLYVLPFLLFYLCFVVLLFFFLIAVLLFVFALPHLLLWFLFIFLKIQQSVYQSETFKDLSLKVSIGDILLRQKTIRSWFPNMNKKSNWLNIMYYRKVFQFSALFLVLLLLWVEFSIINFA